VTGRSRNCPKCGTVLRDFWVNRTPGAITCAKCGESFDPRESFPDSEIEMLSRGLPENERDSFMQAAGFVRKPRRQTDWKFVIFLIFVIFTGCFLYSYSAGFELRETAKSSAILLWLALSLVLMRLEEKKSKWVRRRP